MSNPEPVDPEPNAGQESPHSCHRLWRWGIWFWILLWIFSVLVAGGFGVELKGCPGMALGVSHGSLLVVRRDHQETGKANAITWINPVFIWSEYDHRHYSEHPEFLFEWLGGVIWRTSGDRHMTAFPVSGFLWLWLLGGWVARVRKSQRSELRSKRILVATLILMPLLILHASRTTSKVWTEREAHACMMNLRNIQCSVRSYWGMNNLYSGKPIPWGEIFGPDKFVPTSIRSCPSGQDYILDARIPAEYRLVVKCPVPEHQQRLKEIDTSGW